MFHGLPWSGQGLVDEWWSRADCVRHAGVVGWQRGRIGWIFKVIPKLWVFLSLSLASFLSYRSSARPKVRQALMPHQCPRVLGPLCGNTAFS